jgi:hypothetical protein
MLTPFLIPPIVSVRVGHNSFFVSGVLHKENGRNNEMEREGSIHLVVASIFA